MENKKKFSKANLLYVFSLLIAITIVVVGFSAANDAKKQIEKQNEALQEAQEKTETVTKREEKIEKEKESETVVMTVKTPVKTEETDEFSPKLEDYIITRPVEGKILTSYTGKSLVYSKYYDDWSVHRGIDISAKASTQVKAAANGIIKAIYKNNRLGTVIEIEHGDFTTVYGNLSTDKLVNIGDKVHAGDIISGVGKTADKKEFLHFEINYKGEDIDPEPLLK